MRNFKEKPRETILDIDNPDCCSLDIRTSWRHTLRWYCTTAGWWGNGNNKLHFAEQDADKR